MKIYYGQPQGFTTLFGVVLVLIGAFIPLLVPEVQDWAKNLAQQVPFIAKYQLLSSFAVFLGAIAVIAILMDLANNGLYRFQWFRCLFDPMARLEGSWLQYTAIKGRPYSFAIIEYVHKQQRYHYYGSALNHYSENQSMGAWDSGNVMFDEKDHRVIFFSDAEVLDNKSALIEIVNFGLLRLEGKNLLSGEVRDVLTGTHEAETFKIEYMKKLSRREIKKVLGKGRPEIIEEKHRLVLAYMPEKLQVKGQELSK